MAGEKLETINNSGWVTRTVFGTGVGLFMTALLWLVVRNAWVGVFVMGVCMGVGTLENWGLIEEARVLRYELEERERDVLGLRLRMTEMVSMNRAIISEVEYKRARLRDRNGRLTKSASF